MSKFVSYKECQKWAIENNITSRRKYIKFKKPIEITASPNIVYENKGWVNWKHFLKTGFVSYEECQKWVINNGIKIKNEYYSFKLPKNIPTNPNQTYKNEWKGWRDFLNKSQITKNKIANTLKTTNKTKLVEILYKLLNNI